MKPTDAIAQSNLKALTGKLRPSGRFSVCQLNPSRTKVLNHARKAYESKETLRTVQQIDQAYDNIVRGLGTGLSEVRPHDRQGGVALVYQMRLTQTSVLSEDQKVFPQGKETSCVGERTQLSLFTEEGICPS